MKCPRCGSQAYIIDFIDSDEFCRRRRRCKNPACDHRYMTVERFHQDCQGPGGFRNSRVSPSEAQEIKELLAAGVLTQAEIARQFGISQQQVSKIKRGLSWGNA